MSKRVATDFVQRKQEQLPVHLRSLSGHPKIKIVVAAKEERWLARRGFHETVPT